MEATHPEIISGLENSFEIIFSKYISWDELKEKLATQINDLIHHDFEKLVAILYKIDVSETKLKTLLATQKEKNAADLITELVIERQLQKIESRKKARPDENISEEEKW